MPDGLNVLADMLVRTSGESTIMPDGSIDVIPDLDMLKYRFQHVDADNYAAFLKSVFDLNALVDTFSSTMRPSTAATLAREVRAEVRHYLVAVTGKSSEYGQFYKALIKDEQTVRHFFKDTSKNRRSFGERIPSFQGEPDPEPAQGGGYQR
ncbi:MAG: hypothetical protein OXQ29_04760 [Rhodospirillaceae bacterium]|nr:hypothetical protein [Rhodospirillaceae bacterium]